MSLCACGDSGSEDKTVTTEAINDDDYRIAMPFQASDSRQTHIEFNAGSIANVDDVGEGLLRYAKDYFSTSSYYLQEGQCLDRDTLQVGTTMDDVEGILGFKSSDNPYGLNPEKGSSIPVTDSKTIKAGTGTNKTIPIVDVFEVDFVKQSKEDAEIKGIALAIVMNPDIVAANGKEYTMDEEHMKTYGAEAARNLVTYLRTLPEVQNNTPIMVALYNESSDEESLPGNYFAVGYGKDNIDKFKTVKEQWVIIPSDTATSLDSTTATEFNAVKSSLFEYLPNNISIIGKGLYLDNKISKLRITVSTQARTYTENEAVVQYLRELLDNFSSKDYPITVKINVDGDTFAMIQRESGSSDTTVIMY